MFWCVPPAMRDEFKAAIATLTRAYGGQTFASDMLVSLLKNQTFLWDEAFTAAVQAEAQDDWDRAIVWRTHTYVWAGKQALNLDGDFVELGVYRGYSSAVLCRCLDWGKRPEKTLWLYDTFAGLHEGSSTPAERAAHDYGHLDPHQWEADVRRRFSAWNRNVFIVRGAVPESLDHDGLRRIALLHIDMNCAAAELAALDRLWDRVVTGGIVLLDDFGWAPQLPQTISQLEFFKERGHDVLELPTGQGMVVKH